MNFRSSILMLCLVAATGFGGLMVWRWIAERKQVTHTSIQSEELPDAPPALVTTINANTIRIRDETAAKELGIRIAQVPQVPLPRPLRLPGSLQVDPNRLVHVHSRFPGEVVLLGQTEGPSARPLRYGDRVKKGQILAAIWCKEVGEKRSELVDALSRLQLSQKLVDRLESLSKGIVTEKEIAEARREVEANLIAVAKAERTLESWRLTPGEIESTRKEAAQLHADKQSRLNDPAEWAQVGVYAAINGVIVEKNFNAGDIIDTTDELFKIADLSQLQVNANVYEEDLWAVRRLPPDLRQWRLTFKSGPDNIEIAGRFELIGKAIDPAQRTGVLFGYLDNREGNYSIGQFVTATIDLPPDETVIPIPETAVIEDGDVSMVFVEARPNSWEFNRREVNIVRRTAGTVFVRRELDTAANAERTPTIQPGDVVIISGVISLSGELTNSRVSEVAHAPAMKPAP